MIDIVRETVKRQNLLEKGDRVIVALSGGADSCALFHILLSLRDEYSLTLYCAHVNHLLRGDEAMSDEAFVRKLAKDTNTELFVKRTDVRALSEELKISEELCGRNVRYEFFRELSENLSAKVATAHTLSDSEETMLFNIARGTSLHGLCSIPYKRDFIVRPLLDVSREQVEEYMKEGRHPFVNDSTNFSEEICTRNKIRHSVLRPLKGVSEGFHKNFIKLRRQLISADDYITESAQKLLSLAKRPFGYDAKVLLESHEAVRSRALAICISKSDIAPQERYIELITDILRINGAVPLCSDTYAVCTQGVFRIVKSSCESFSPVCIKDGGEFTFGGRLYSVRKVRESAPGGVKFYSESKNLVLRKRLPEDTFSPVSRGVRKSLRKLQNELRIPVELREDSLVIADNNIVIWAEHIGVSEDGLVKACDEEFFTVEVTDINA